MRRVVLRQAMERSGPGAMNTVKASRSTYVATGIATSLQRKNFGSRVKGSVRMDATMPERER